MGNQMSSAAAGSRSLVVFDIAADLFALHGEGSPEEESSDRKAECGKKCDLLKILRNVNGLTDVATINGQSKLVVPISLASLYHADGDLDGRFSRRDVEKTLTRWHKYNTQAKKRYRGLPKWKRDRLLSAVSEWDKRDNARLLTPFVIRKILGEVHSRSIWDRAAGQIKSLRDPCDTVEESCHLQNLAISALASERMLTDDRERMAESIRDHKESFCSWLWKLITVQEDGLNRSVVTVDTLSALLVILYEDTIDIEQLAFSTKFPGAQRCHQFDPISVDEETIKQTTVNLIEVYSHESKNVLKDHDFMNVADLISKIYQQRGGEVKPVGRYEVKSSIGTGANGVIHLGRDVFTDKRVALKSYLRRDAGAEIKVDTVMKANPDVESLLKVYEAVLPHPHVTSIIDVIVSDDQINLVYPFCGGGSLFELLSYRRMELTDNMSDIGSARSSPRSSPRASPRTSPRASPRNSFDERRSHALSHRTGSPMSVETMVHMPAAKVDVGHRTGMEQRHKVRDSLRVLSLRHRTDKLASVGGQCNIPDTPAEHVDGPLASEEEAQMIIHALASALLGLHERGICHRDLQLRNLLYNTAKDMVELADFDTALQMPPGWDILDGEAVVGSLYALSPEQIAKQAYSGMAADMWAVGVCMYWLLKGRPPFVANSPDGVVKAIRAHDYEPITGISLSAQQLLARLLSVNPASRPTASEVLVDNWFTSYSKTSLKPLLTSYRYESPVTLRGAAQVELASKIVESILSDGGAHRVASREKDREIFFCTLPEHDMKLAIDVSVHDTHAVLMFQSAGGAGLNFVKASRKISRLWSHRLHALVAARQSVNSEGIGELLEKQMKKPSQKWQLNLPHLNRH
ncbi:hypothetical protein NDN08_008222 [Rhodosorus marinus]|uniref:Protein kinase domain-containing protein n=1 Tax=Rhodosorus marinus TaxID=101924 RepID=A0AAV8V3Z6_9RHOD|nr:hypothetical protein NDN08_008222 [Rhodosorus marinus]